MSELTIADELYLTKRELHQQRFNNKHNLSIDQKIADVIEDLRADLEQAAILLSNGSPTKGSVVDRLILGWDKE